MRIFGYAFGFTPNLFSKVICCPPHLFRRSCLDRVCNNMATLFSSRNLSPFIFEPFYRPALLNMLLVSLHIFDYSLPDTTIKAHYQPLYSIINQLLQVETTTN